MQGKLEDTWRALASAWATFLLERLADLGRWLTRHAEDRSRRRAAAPPPARGAEGPTDERTKRREGEAAHGGMSSEEGSARWESGEHPGGLHNKAPRAPAEEEAERMPERERPEQEEPQGRKERARHGEKHMAETRRGS